MASRDDVRTATKELRAAISEFRQILGELRSLVDQVRGWGRQGGLRRAQRLSTQERQAIAKKAAEARWGKPKS